MSAWTFHDPVTGETWVHPISPDKMTSPQRSKQTKHAAGVRTALSRLSTFLLPPQPKEWTFEGVIRTQAHHDELERWAKKPRAIHVTDHYGRTWEVAVRKFTPTDRQSNRKVPWRLRYSMSTFILRRVS